MKFNLNVIMKADYMPIFLNLLNYPAERKALLNLLRSIWDPAYPGLFKE